MKTKKRISVQSAKSKGRNLQKWTAGKIAELLGIPYGPDELIASRPMGQSGTDIVLKGEAAEKFKWSVECKCQESWSIPAWIEQARKNQGTDTDWLLVVKRSRIAPVVVMDAEVFFNLQAQLKQRFIKKV